MAYVIASLAAGFAEIVAQFAPLQIQQARQRLDQHGFPAAVRSDDRQMLVGVQREVDRLAEAPALVPDHASRREITGFRPSFSISVLVPAGFALPLRKDSDRGTKYGFAGAHSNIIVYGFPSDPYARTLVESKPQSFRRISEPSAKNPQPKPAQSGARRHAEANHAQRLPQPAEPRARSIRSVRIPSSRNHCPAAGFRTFPQRPQTDARTAPVSIPGQNHTRKSSPSAAPAHRTARCRAEDSAKADSARPGDQCDGPLPVKEAAVQGNRVVRSGGYRPVSRSLRPDELAERPAARNPRPARSGYAP